MSSGRPWGGHRPLALASCPPPPPPTTDGLEPCLRVLTSPPLCPPVPLKDYVHDRGCACTDLSAVRNARPPKPQRPEPPLGVRGRSDDAGALQPEHRMLQSNGKYAYVTFVPPFGRERITLLSSDLFLKAVPIFPTLLGSPTAGHPVSESG